MTQLRVDVRPWPWAPAVYGLPLHDLDWSHPRGTIYHDGTSGVLWIHPLDQVQLETRLFVRSALLRAFPWLREP